MPRAPSLSAAVVYASAGAEHDARAACPRDGAARQSIGRPTLSRLRPFGAVGHGRARRRGDSNTLRARSRCWSPRTTRCALPLGYGARFAGRRRGLRRKRASRGAADDARLEWWAARANHELRASEPARADVPIAELNALSSARASLSVRGRALNLGASLAARVGDSDSARRWARPRATRRASFCAVLPVSCKPPYARSTGYARSTLVPRPRSSRSRSPTWRRWCAALSQRDRLRPLLRQVVGRFGAVDGRRTRLAPFARARRKAEAAGGAQPAACRSRPRATGLESITRAARARVG